MDSVADDEALYRSITPDKGLYHILPDGRVRFSSQAFADKGKRPSVDRARLRDDDPSHAQLSPVDGVTCLITHEVRAIDNMVRNDAKGRIIHIFAVDVTPDPLEDNPAHALIYLQPELEVNDKVFRRLLERLARIADEHQWVLPPTEAKATE